MELILGCKVKENFKSKLREIAHAEQDVIPESYLAALL